MAMGLGKQGGFGSEGKEGAGRLKDSKEGGGGGEERAWGEMRQKRTPGEVVGEEKTAHEKEG